MKTKEQKQREARQRQEAYNQRLDTEFKRLRVAKSRLAYLQDKSPSQQRRLCEQFHINPSTGEQTR